MDIELKQISELDDVPGEASAVILNLTRMKNGVAFALDFRQIEGAQVSMQRLLEKSSSSEKNAIRLAKDLAVITCTERVYIIHCHDDPEQGS